MAICGVRLDLIKTNYKKKYRVSWQRRKEDILDEDQILRPNTWTKHRDGVMLVKEAVLVKSLKSIFFFLNELICVLATDHFI